MEVVLYLEIIRNFTTKDEYFLLIGSFILCVRLIVYTTYTSAMFPKPGVFSKKLNIHLSIIHEHKDTNLVLVFFSSCLQQFIEYQNHELELTITIWWRTKEAYRFL